MGRVIRKSPGKKYGVVTIVEHADETDDAQQTIRLIINELLTQGVPVSDILHETSGRGEDEEIVEDLDRDKLGKMISDCNIQFTHSLILEELFNNTEYSEMSL